MSMSVPPKELWGLKRTKGIYVQPQGRPRRVKVWVNYGWETKDMYRGVQPRWITEPAYSSKAGYFDLAERAAEEVYPVIFQMSCWNGWGWDGPMYYTENSVFHWKDYLIALNLRPDLGYDINYARRNGIFGPDYARDAYLRFLFSSAYGRLPSDREDPIPEDASPEYVRDYLEARREPLLDLFRTETTWAVTSYKESMEPKL